MRDRRARGSAASASGVERSRKASSGRFSLEKDFYCQKSSPQSNPPSPPVAFLKTNRSSPLPAGGRARTSACASRPCARPVRERALRGVLGLLGAVLLGFWPRDSSPPPPARCRSSVSGPLDGVLRAQEDRNYGTPSNGTCGGRYRRRVASAGRTFSLLGPQCVVHHPVVHVHVRDAEERDAKAGAEAQPAEDARGEETAAHSANAGTPLAMARRRPGRRLAREVVRSVQQPGRGSTPCASSGTRPEALVPRRRARTHARVVLHAERRDPPPAQAGGTQRPFVRTPSFFFFSVVCVFTRSRAMGDL